MDIVVVTENQMQQLRAHQEERELEELRAGVRVKSIEDSQARFENLQLACAVALSQAEDAYIYLVEDDLDDFETAQAKADKLDRIEREHDRAIATWENQRRRLGWEARQV